MYNKLITADPTFPDLPAYPLEAVKLESRSVEDLRALARYADYRAAEQESLSTNELDESDRPEKPAPTDGGHLSKLGISRLYSTSATLRDPTIEVQILQIRPLSSLRSGSVFWGEKSVINMN